MLYRAVKITIKDMKIWFRQPYLILIAVIPLMIVSLFMGLVMAKVEVLPIGIILEDSNDKIALEMAEYISNMKSGTGLNWFEAEEGNEKDIIEKFNKGKILAYIIIPNSIGSKINNGDVIDIDIIINNINDDVTKNVLQRMQKVCNHFNNKISIDNKLYYSPIINFEAIPTPDLRFPQYVMAAMLALSILMGSGVNIVTATAREFEDKTHKELIMSPPIASIFIGKLFTTIIQTCICFMVVLLEAILVFNFIPSGNLFVIMLFIIWGSLCFSSIGFIMAVKIKSVIPAAISVLIINLIGWWIGGGLVPSGIWIGFIGFLAKIWPGSYFFESFIDYILLGKANSMLLFRNLLITGLFGITLFIIAIKVFLKEVKL